MDLAFLDRLVRGSAPDRDRVSTARLVAAICALGAIVGLCMALYGLTWGTQYGAFHLLAVMVKVPALFLLTLVVTCPSLYVFSALSGTGLSFRETARLLLTASALACVVLASLAPIVAFFTFSTRSHPFLQVLNAVFFTIAGVLALRFVVRRLAAVMPTEPVSSKARLGLARPELRVVVAWTFVYALVGSQMSWMLRPFVGSPNLPQEMFRDVESNVFAGLAQALKYLN